MTARVLVFAALLASPTMAHGYTHIVVPSGRAYVALRWPMRALPVRFGLNDQTGSQLQNLAPGSDPVAAIERALTRWHMEAVVELDYFTTSIASAREDGVNLISFANTAANVRFFEMSGEPLALTLSFFEAGRITEADVIFNPAYRFSTTVDDQSELIAAALSDVEAIAVHELGHAIGLHHSGVESAAMWTFSSLTARVLDPDDVAGAQTLYRRSETGTGSIAGSVRVAGQGALGAHVVAVSAGGPVYSGLTLPDGGYEIGALPAGDYRIYVEPLDGPHSARPLDGCVRFGTMSGAGIYDGTLTTGFRTAFHGDGEPAFLRAGETLSIHFDIPSAAPELNPVVLGPANDDGSVERLSVIPFEVSAGSEQRIAIAGPGLDQAASVSVIGDGIEVDTTSQQSRTATCAGQPSPVLTFRIAVAPDASGGGRTIVVESHSGERAAFSGAIRVRAADPTPTAAATPTPSPTPRSPAPCVGDCNGNDEVRVNELIIGINIGLEKIPLTACTDFDSSGDGWVGINELVQSVNALLGGCITSDP